MKFLKDNRVLDIEEANPDDAEAIVKYLNTVGKESTFLILDEEGFGMTVEQEKEYLTKIQSSFNNTLFVGKVDEKIVSVGGVNGSPKKRVSHNVGLGISVLKEFWNLGVGNHMMNHIVNYCRLTKGIENIMLEVRADNKYAIQLYEKMGFKKIGTAHRKFKVEGQYFDELIYELLL